MFKSPFSRIAALVLVLGSLVLPVSADPVVDSTLIQLADTAFNQTLDRAILYQRRADSLRRLSIEWRKEAARMDDPTERGRLQKRIEQLEDSLAWYGKLADEQFRLLAEGADATREPGSPHRFLVRDTVLNGITVYRYRLTDEFMEMLEEIRSGDAGKEKTGTKKEDGKQAVANLAEVRPGTGLVILDRSPYSEERPFELEYAIPRGVFYRIQIAVYSSQVAWDQFGGLSPITTESIPGKGMTRYYAGKFTRMEEAQKAILRVKSLGYPDAFIVGYYNGQKGSFSKLKALEKE